MDHALKMDRMYRHTRHVYDASRRYFLLGRDQLLRTMDLSPGDRVVEVGCGTARNLIKLHRLRPACELFGIDASTQMLETAERSIRRHGLDRVIHVRQGLAEQLDYRWAFGQDRPFDAVFFSYSLTMIPAWSDAIDNALGHVRPGGRIYIVDFCDQAELPRAVAGALQRFLRAFHVEYRPALLQRLNDLDAAGAVTCETRTLYRRYAYIATLTRTG